MATLYDKYDDIPNASEYQRVVALCGTARAKLENKRADVLSDAEWNAIAILEPSTAERARALVEQQANEQRQSQQKQAPSKADRYEFKDDDTFDQMCERNSARPAPIGMVQVVVEEMGKLFGIAKGKREALEQRVAALEARASENKSLEYFGVFDGDQRYRRNSAVTYDGSVWISRTDNPGVPGVDKAGWTCAVPRGKQGSHGRDGKDCR